MPCASLLKTTTSLRSSAVRVKSLSCAPHLTSSCRTSTGTQLNLLFFRRLFTEFLWRAFVLSAAVKSVSVIKTQALFSQACFSFYLRFFRFLCDILRELFSPYRREPVTSPPTLICQKTIFIIYVREKA